MKHLKELEAIMAQLLKSLRTEIFRRVEQSVPERSASIFKRCFVDTLGSAMCTDPDGTVFALTGDIPAMWLRDSMWQLSPYLHFLNQDEQLLDLATGVSRKQLQYVLIDPYANAFNHRPDFSGHQDDKTAMGPWIWERKYEVDSLCAPIILAYEIWCETGTTVHLENFERALESILSVWEIEQNHDSDSLYRFQRLDPLKPSDTLSRRGRGSEVGFSGMTWSAFRPSDDATMYGYNIPDNIFAVLALKRAAELVEKIHDNKSLAKRSRHLASVIEKGIMTYGVVSSGVWGDVYAYEVDGIGHHLLMDDANIPSLLSLPYLGWNPQDPIYQHTRKMILSDANPYWYSGTSAEGIGSPHTPQNFIWPIALAIQGITADDKNEKMKILSVLSSTDASTGLIHESFNANNPSEYTRPWFSWANAMYCEFVLSLAGFDIRDQSN